jgi:hypothetical protein
VAKPRWQTRSTRLWRGTLGLATAAALALLAIALLSQVGRVRDDDTVGAPSAAPAPGGPPFIVAPDGFFTPLAMADAQVRLGRVFAETGMEATLIVQPAERLDEVTTPPGWPDGYDRDGDSGRDVTAVAGYTPDRRIVCCLTITGALLEDARQYWQPAYQPSALDDELSGETAEFRDVALELFVRGIERFAESVVELGTDPHPGDALIRWTPVALGLALTALAIAAIPRRRATIGAGPTDAGESTALTDDAGPTPSGVDLEISGSQPSLVETSGSSEPRRSSAVRGVAPLWIALLALGAIAVVTIVDAVRPADPSTPLDVDRQTVGVVTPGAPVIPGILASIALIALLAYALHGGWRRRLGVSVAVVVIGLSSWIGLETSRPAGRLEDISWASSPQATDQSTQFDGLIETLTFDLAPGETFTLAGVVGNPGALPVTLLGLEEVHPTGGNPHVASIVGLAWVPQPMDDGRVHLLSAVPGATSATWPITLAPGEEAVIVVLGRAGPCAEPGGAGSVIPLTSYSMTYRTLGIERSTMVGLPATVVVPAKSTCTVSIPGGTVTYGRPPASSAAPSG